MILRMTIEVELDEGARLALDEDKLFFENVILKDSELISNYWIGENKVGTITKIETIDYLEHEVKE